MQRISLINDKNQDQWILPSNLIGSAPIAFNICVIGDSDVLYLQFFRKTEVFRGVCRLVMCLKVSGRIFFSENTWITMKKILAIAEKNEKPEVFAEEATNFPRRTFEAFMDWKTLSKFSQDFFLSENAWITMQRIPSGQEKNLNLSSSREGRWFLPEVKAFRSVYRFNIFF